MPDKFSPEVRSRIMSRIRSKWTKPEKKLHNLLKGNKIQHIMHPNLPGNPDAYIKAYNAVVFVDGCFWHNCPKHGHVPEGNKKYWKPKIAKNVARDQQNSLKLSELGYIVIRIWECEIMRKEFSGKTFKKLLTNKMQKGGKGEGSMMQRGSYRPIEVEINSTEVCTVIKDGNRLFAFSDLGDAFGLHLRSRPMQISMKAFERKGQVYSLSLVSKKKNVRFLEYDTFRQIVENAMPIEIKDKMYTEAEANKILKTIREYAAKFEL